MGDGDLLHAKASQLTQQLTAKGLLIEAGFQSLYVMAFPEAPADQVKFARELFFAGAQHLLSSVMAMLDGGEEPTDGDMQRMTLIADELERFGQKFMADLPTEGQA